MDMEQGSLPAEAQHFLSDINRLLAGGWEQSQKEDFFVALILNLGFDLSQLTGNAQQILVSFLERAGVEPGEEDPLGVVDRYFASHPLPASLLAELRALCPNVDAHEDRAWDAFSGSSCEGEAALADEGDGPSVSAGPLARFKLNRD